MPHPLSTASRIDEQQIRALPKAEVHVHLEGTFSLIDLLALAKENGVRLPGPAATIFDISTHAGYTAPGVTSGGGSGAGSAGLRKRGLIGGILFGRAVYRRGKNKT